MKTLFTLIFSLFLISIGAQEIEKIEEKQDDNGIYYDVSISGFILPVDATAAVGYSALDGRVEAEAYAGVRAIRFLAKNDASLHIPYGARVRVAVDPKKQIYLEYEHEEVLDFGNEYGLLSDGRTFSVVWAPRDKQGKRKNYSVGCGYQSYTHNAWSNEDHAPERGGFLKCRVSRRF